MQTLLFLIAREVPAGVGGPYFGFRPSRHGPFDRAVFDELDELGRTGEVEISENADWRAFALTEAGFQKGVAVASRLPDDVRTYIRDLARWVLSLSFARLLSAICRHYPDMATESAAPNARRHFPERPFLDGMATVFDLGGNLGFLASRESRTRGDSEALASDWRAVGDDLRAAMAAFAVGRPESD